MENQTKSKVVEMKLVGEYVSQHTDLKGFFDFPKDSTRWLYSHDLQGTRLF